MSDNTTYTPVEVAKKLKISKFTVYELIKRGELDAYRIGRKIRIEEASLEAYKQNNKNLPANPLPNSLADSPVIFTPSSTVNTLDGLLICGQDMILDILTRHLTKQFPTIKFLRSHMGSIDSLMALYRGQANVATAHLWDSDSNEYNLPYVRRLLPGHQTIVINLVYRLAGFYVVRDNPKNIKTWQDLTRPEVRFINRERGSGARVLLDEKLQQEGISNHSINGYHDEEMSHMSVASKVARGEADVGLGIEKVAMQVPDLDFIPLQKERYDLVFRQEDLSKPHFQALLQIIRSSAYRKEIEGLGGYDVSQMGEIMK